AGGLVVGDPDRDGDLDIVMTHWDGPGWYFVNSGSLSFSEVAAQRIPGLEFSTFHFAPVFADFNNDGWPDLHVAVDVDADYHARNQGGG
ncbi:MAG: VCBS repeat-containing protein, partial [Planctomycetes bacterium]|nr:VCBS repeat-containing protein [Planctomycetota bacterium]